MKSLKDYIGILDEEYYKPFETTWPDKDSDKPKYFIHTFKNPTKKELEENIFEEKFGKQARGFITKEGDLIVWKINEFHGDMYTLMFGGQFEDLWNDITEVSILPVTISYGNVAIASDWRFDDLDDWTPEEKEKFVLKINSLIDKCHDKNQWLKFQRFGE